MDMHTLAAVGILDDVAGIGSTIKVLLAGTVMVIMYLAAVAATGFTTRSMLKTGAVAVGGALVLGIVASQTILSNKTADELKKDHSTGAAPTTVTVQDLRVQPGSRGLK